MSKIAALAQIGRAIGKPRGWERVVRLLAPPETCKGMKECCVVLDGVPFIVQPSTPLGWYQFFFGTYEPEVRAVIKSTLRPGGVAIDVGANVGWHAVLMAQIVGDRGHVLAIEPNPSVRQQLHRNISLNRMSQTQVISCAMVDKPGEVSFFGPEQAHADSGNGHIVSGNNITENDPTIYRVDGIRLDDVVAQAQLKRVDLIKIDIEGFEWLALLGARDTIVSFRPVIIFEFNKEYIPRCGANVADFENFFRGNGYDLFSLGRGRPKAIAGGQWPDNADILAVPQQPRGRGTGAFVADFC